MKQSTKMMKQNISLFIEVIQLLLGVVLCDEDGVWMVYPPGGTPPLVPARGTPVGVDVSPRVVEPSRADEAGVILGERIGADGNVLTAGVLVGWSAPSTAPARPAGGV